MTGNDLVLRFRPPPENESQHANDMRTVNIKQVTVVDGQEAETDLYKVRDCFSILCFFLSPNYCLRSSTIRSFRAFGRV